jgi:hypothetical protein
MRQSSFHCETNGVTSHFLFTKVAIPPGVRTVITICSVDSTYCFRVIDSTFSNPQIVLISREDACAQAQRLNPGALTICEPAKPSGLYFLNYATVDSVYSEKVLYVR